MSNIITARFDGATTCKTEAAYQYNYGQILYFPDLTLPTSFEVHFANLESGESVTQIGTNNRVTIPDSVFEGLPNYYTSNKIYAWVFLHTGDDDGETMYKVTIPLIRRAEPSDEEPTTTEQSAINQAIEALNTAVDTVEGYLGNYAPCIVETASGDIASFEDGADDTPMHSLIVNIEPKQSGSGTPSPSNIRAITGASDCHITVANSNLLSDDATSPYATLSNGTFTNTGTDTKSNLILQIQLWNGSTYVSNIGASISSTGEKTITFTVPSNVTSLKLKHNGNTLDLAVTVPFYASSGTFTFACTVEGYDPTTVGGIVLRNCRINVGSTALNYEAYNGTVHPVTWSSEAGTIYGGYADVVNGTLTKTHRYVDLGTLAWVKTAMYNGIYGFRASVNDMMPATSASVAIDAICSNYPTLSGNQVYLGNVGISGWSTSAMIAIYDSNMEGYTAIEFLSAMDGVQLVYPLATPLTYTLTSPVEISTILGTNNVFADCGSIESCEYVADTKKYIDNAIATAIASL